MDLSALLAREGIQADDADVLVAWARQRAAALVERIEPDSALAQQLGLTLEHARSVPADGGPDVPKPISRQASRSGPRSTNRMVSRPHLGAAVQAALTRDEPALERALETVDLEISVEVEDDEYSPPAPVAAAPAPAPVEEAPAPEPEPEVEDASIGGFNRFAFSVRRRVIETSPPEDPATARPTLTRGFELHHESSTSGSWEVSDLDLPAPPGFEARSRAMPIGLPADSEGSGLLVVGIPDDEDIPVPRTRIDSRSIAAPFTRPPSGPHFEPQAARSSEPLEPQAARSSDVLEFDSGALDLDGLDLDIPEPPRHETTRPQSMARPISSPHRSPPPPPPARSGPHPGVSQSGPLAASRPPSVPTPTAPRPESAPLTAAAQPFAPEPAAAAQPKPGVRGRGKTPTAEQKQVKAPEPKPAATKKGKGRKKVVELGQPVAHEPVPVPVPIPMPRRTSSIGNHRPTGEPSSAGQPVPAYLQDDDE